MKVVGYDFFGIIIFQFVQAKYNGVILKDTTFILRKTVVFYGLADGTYKYEKEYHFSPFSEGEKPPSDNWTQTHPELQ